MRAGGCSISIIVSILNACRGVMKIVIKCSSHPCGQEKLVHEMNKNPCVPFLYRRARNFVQYSEKCFPVFAELFEDSRLACPLEHFQPPDLMRPVLLESCWRSQ